MSRYTAQTGLALLVLFGASACALPAWLGGRPAVPPTPGEGVGSPVDFAVTAAPVFRLVANPALLDVPSRLLVMRVVLQGTGQSYFGFGLQDFKVAFPDGTTARVFDQPRALELLRRTMIADADMSYLARGEQGGGVSDDVRESYHFMISNKLLSDGSFGPQQPLEGYVVIDTQQPLMSLSGASLEVVARRVGDDAPTRYACQLANGAATTEAQ
ncbi:MAG: hypothetical protein AB7V27_04095 [Candidatus Binatia bacterium]